MPSGEDDKLDVASRSTDLDLDVNSDGLSGTSDCPLYYVDPNSSLGTLFRDVEEEVLRVLSNDDYFMEGVYSLAKNPPTYDIRGGVRKNVLRVLTGFMEARKGASIDYLTGLFVRSAFYKMVSPEISKLLSRYEKEKLKQRVGMAMFDLDNFKVVNDRYGHQVGDAVLQEFAKQMKALLRVTHDLIVRWGGEEFVFVLKGLSLEKAQGVDSHEELLKKVLDRYRESVKIYITKKGKVVSEKEEGAFRVTFSAGAVLVDKDNWPDSAVGMADKALYASKAGGRNMVTIFNDEIGNVEEV